MDRILDISESAATLHVRYSQLVIEPEGRVEVTIPLADLSVLVISHPRVLMTQAVIAGLAENGGSLVICGENFLPTAMMLPLQTHTTQTRAFRQAGASVTAVTEASVAADRAGQNSCARAHPARSAWQ
jgi:CRISPR/Cas system-associated endonuclease Cas1